MRRTRLFSPATASSNRVHSRARTSPAFMRISAALVRPRTTWMERSRPMVRQCSPIQPGSDRSSVGVTNGPERATIGAPSPITMRRSGLIPGMHLRWRIAPTPTKDLANLNSRWPTTRLCRRYSPMPTTTKQPSAACSRSLRRDRVRRHRLRRPLFAPRRGRSALHRRRLLPHDRLQPRRHLRKSQPCRRFPRHHQRSGLPTISAAGSRSSSATTATRIFPRTDNLPTPSMTPVLSR